MLNNKFFLGAVFVVALGIGGYFTLGGGAGNAPGMPPLNAAHAQSADADAVVIQDMVLGSDDAPITVIEYASYTCPHCETFHRGPLWLAWMRWDAAPWLALCSRRRLFWTR